VKPNAAGKIMNSASDRSNTADLSQFSVSGKAGDDIFQEGDEGMEMYIIQEGEIEIVKEFGDQSQRLALLEVGDFFGEMSLLEETPRAATARAVTDYVLVRIDYSTFDQMVQENPEIAIRMLRKLSHRLREKQDAENRATRIAEEVLSEQQEAPVSQPEQVVTPYLVVASNGERFPLSQKPQTTIGRFDRATGLAPDVDFTEVDTERTLSRRHAKINRKDDGFYLCEDIRTGNGTFLNEERIETGKWMKLSDGDQIRFGLIKTTFRLNA
jgi:CRP-like cAMP-binding protein